MATEKRTQKEWKQALREIFCDCAYDYQTGKHTLNAEDQKAVEASLVGATVLFEGHDAEQFYEDRILVVFKRGGKLYTVEGSHCSCNGFEGQWSETEVSLAFFRRAFEAKDAGRQYESGLGFLSDEDYAELKRVIGKQS